MKKPALVLSLLAVISLCAVVIYRTIGVTVDDGYVSAEERALIKKFDGDGDGKLSGPEQRAADAAVKAAEKEKQEWLKKFDRNGDGKLSREERAAAGEAKSLSRETLVKKFDRDGDGKLNEEEALAARKALGR